MTRCYLAWFLVLALQGLPAAAEGGAAATLSEEVVQVSGVSAGLCVQIECIEGRMVSDLAKTGRFLVHALTSDRASVAALRQRLADEDLAGLATVGWWAADRLPHATNLANLVVAEDFSAAAKMGLPLAEVLRVLAPGGVDCLGISAVDQPAFGAELKRAGVAGFRFVPRSRLWLVMRKPRPAGMDDWSHLRHGPDANPVSRDLLIERPNQLQWITGPSSKTLRADVVPATGHVRVLLSSNGRNYYLVGPRLIARDSFNGLVLWQQSASSLSRVERTNMVATESGLCLVRGDELIELDGATGRQVRSFGDTAQCQHLVLSDGLLLTFEDDQVRAFETATGKPRWANTAAAKVRWPAVEGGRIYYFRKRSELTCLNLADGKLAWYKDLAGDLGNKCDLAFAFQGKALVCAEQPGGTVFAAYAGADGNKGAAMGRIDPHTGQDLNRYIKEGMSFGWLVSRFNSDRYGMLTVPVARLGQHIVRVDNKARAIAVSGAGGWKAEVPAPSMVEALATAGEMVLAAISRNNPKEPGGELWLLAGADGAKRAAGTLPCDPAYDGIAVAHHKVFVTLQDGTVACLGAPE